VTLAQLIPIAINVSLFAIVFALGLRTTRDDLFFPLREPGLLLRSILSMNVVMPVIAVAVALVFDLPRPVEIAIVALAISPVPPILPNKQVKAGGTKSYAVGLLVSASILAIVIVPAATELAGAVFGGDYHMPVGRVLSIVAMSVLLPLAIGAGVRHVLPSLADRVSGPISLLATLLLVVAALPVAITVWRDVWTLTGHGVVMALILFTLIGLLVGHLLGGPEPDDRTDLALATSTRHPGIAIAIAAYNFPEEKAVLAVVVFHLIFGAIAALPYVRWRKRAHAANVGQSP
jgi:BASS family bile acid:Na+ symporter